MKKIAKAPTEVKEVEVLDDDDPSLDQVQDRITLSWDFNDSPLTFDLTSFDLFNIINDVRQLYPKSFFRESTEGELALEKKREEISAEFSLMHEGYMSALPFFLFLLTRHLQRKEGIVIPIRWWKFALKSDEDIVEDNNIIASEPDLNSYLEEQELRIENFTAPELDATRGQMLLGYAEKFRFKNYLSYRQLTECLTDIWSIVKAPPKK